MQDKKSVKYISKHIKFQQSFGPTIDSHEGLEQTCLGIHSLQIESQSNFPSDFPHIKIKNIFTLKKYAIYYIFSYVHCLKVKLCPCQCLFLNANLNIGNRLIIKVSEN